MYSHGPTLVKFFLRRDLIRERVRSGGALRGVPDSLRSPPRPYTYGRA
jgi:hypothetical protein